LPTYPPGNCSIPQLSTLNRVGHPEGGVEPSEADADVTRRIKQAGEIVGIHLLDHIIFNPATYFSFLEAGKL